MNRKSIHISIPDPCHESWDSMNATGHGAFCHSCQKDVIDFSAMTDHEVIEFLSKHKTECGRFRQDQVDRKLSPGLIRNGFLKWKALAVGCLSLLAFKGGFASRNKPLTIQTSEVKCEADTIAASSSKQITVSGKVLDSASQKPLLNAKIYIKENHSALDLDTMDGQIHSIPMDKAGRFEFKTDSVLNGFPVILVIDCPGYKSEWISIKTNQLIQNYNINLVPMSKEPFYFIKGRMKP